MISSSDYLFVPCRQGQPMTVRFLSTRSIQKTYHFNRNGGGKIACLGKDNCLICATVAYIWKLANGKEFTSEGYRNAVATARQLKATPRNYYAVINMESSSPCPKLLVVGNTLHEIIQKELHEPIKFILRPGLQTFWDWVRWIFTGRMPAYPGLSSASSPEHGRNFVIVSSMHHTDSNAFVDHCQSHFLESSSIQHLWKKEWWPKANGFFKELEKPPTRAEGADANLLACYEFLQSSKLPMDLSLMIECWPEDAKREIAAALTEAIGEKPPEIYDPRCVHVDKDIQ